MDSKKELEAKLNQMKSEITSCSDQELDLMGMETSVMLAVLSQQLGEEHNNTKACQQLLDILRTEYSRRHGNMPEEQTEAKAEVKPKEKLVIPKTFNELMCLGDGSVGEPEMVKI